MIGKPSPETPLTALSLAYLAERAGFPKGVFNVLPTTLTNTPALSERLCRHELIKKVTFTGSVSGSSLAIGLTQLTTFIDSSWKADCEPLC
jgi:acyl-CoA reductase-like NAD-dependent aldehyde dehydrogenase